MLDALKEAGWVPVNIMGLDFIKGDLTLSLFKESFHVWNIQKQKMLLEVHSSFTEDWITLLP